MNSKKNLELIQIISEKILPEKIKTISWNTKVDLISINCGNYFEIHRIGYKHEEIFRKEEKCEIKKTSFLQLDETETLVVILADSTVYYVNCSTCEISLKLKYKKSEQFEEIFGEKVNVSQNILQAKLDDHNPFKGELNFNSFSKIDVSHINFLKNNKNITYSYIYNKKSGEIEMLLNFLIQTSLITLNNRNSILRTRAISCEEPIILIIQHFPQNDNLLEFNTLPLNLLTKDRSDIINQIFFQISYSIQIIEYITNILSIFSKIIYKLGMVFFDKYVFANGLEHQMTDEKSVKDQLNNELKTMMFLGNVSDSMKTLLKNDLFEGKSIIKMDENIHFNLKNIEDIFVENIKPSLNALAFYFTEIKQNSKILLPNKSNKADFSKFNYLGIIFEQFISRVSLMKKGYRNFISWLNGFSHVVVNLNEMPKSYLNNQIIDFDMLSSFIDNQNYNMKDIYEMLEGADEISEDKQKENKKIIFSHEVKRECQLGLMKNELVRNFIFTNNLENCFRDKTNSYSDKVISVKQTDNSEFIKSILTVLKEKLIKLRTNLSYHLGNEIKTENLFKISNLSLANIKDMKVKENLILIRITDNLSTLDKLLIFEINKQTKILFLLKVNFYYETIQILDFDLHINQTQKKITDCNSNQQLILLVRTIIRNDPQQGNYDNNNSTSKYSLIASEMENYDSWVKLDTSNSKTLKIENILLAGSEAQGEIIKMDKFIDVDCSESSYISSGERGLIGLVDNRKNKITIFDITSTGK